MTFLRSVYSSTEPTLSLWENMQPRPPKHQTAKSSANFLRGVYSAMFITAISSILVLAFSADASATYRGITQNGLVITISPLRPDNENDGLTLALYPLYLDRSLASPSIAAAGISLAMALGIVLLCIFVRRRGKALLRLTIFIALAGSCILSLVVHIINGVQHFQSGKFDPRYRSPIADYTTYGPNSEYDRGTFDLGSWSCQVGAYKAFDNSHHILSRQCTDETAALWIGLLLVLSNVVMAGLVWVDHRGSKLLIRDYDAVIDEYDVDYI